jgi:hypothetical protein
MSHRQHPTRKSRQVEWKCVAVNGKTPALHAKKLEEALNDLTENGFTLTNMQQRGSAVILTSSRIVEPPVPEVPRELDRSAN